MKIKLSKTAILGVIFIFLMLGSTVAYAVLQGMGNTNQSNKINLPKSNIIDYELDANTENYLVGNGVTIAKFYYTQNCLDCSAQKSALESFVNQYSNPIQIVLEEIQSSNTTGTFPSLIILSYRGQKVLEKATNDEIMNGFCDLMYQPPVQCAVNRV